MNKSDSCSLGGLASPAPLSVGEVTHRSLEIIWEDSLDKANDLHGSLTADRRIKVVFKQRVMTWPDAENWKTLYVGFAGRFTVDNLAPATEYQYRVQFIDSSGLCSEWSPVLTCKTLSEPYYGSDLHKALILDSEEQLLKILEAQEANVNIMDKFGYSPLMQASIRGLTGMVNLLLTYSADPDFQNDTGKTAMMVAAHAGLLAIVKLLRGHGARYDLKDIGGNTALHWACDSKNTELVDWMLNDGAAVDPENNNKYTPLLHLASVGGSSDIATVLIRHKANVNATGKNGRSVMMLAVLTGNVGLVELLLRENVDVSSKTRFGKSIYDMALVSDKKAIVLAIEKHLARLKTKH